MSTKQRIACLDTQILSYLILKDPLSADYNERATQLITRLYDQNVNIIIPTLCVSELLVAYAPHEQNGIRAVIEQNFRSVPFDNLAAVQTARAYRMNKERGQHEDFKTKNPSYPRQKLKVDHMIVGVAMANKVDMLYTNDSGLFNFSQGHVAAMMLPEAGPRQMDIELDPSR